MHSMELRPRTVGEILDVAFKLYTSNIRKLLIISAVVFIPIGIIQLFVTSGSGIDTIDLFDPDAMAGGELPSGIHRFHRRDPRPLADLADRNAVRPGGVDQALRRGVPGNRPDMAGVGRFGIDKSLLILGTAFCPPSGAESD
jgi:hypothetical protein